LKLNCHALDQQDNKNTHKLCTDNKKEISLSHPSYTPRKRRQLLPRRNQNTYQICIAHIKNQLNIYTNTQNGGGREHLKMTAPATTIMKIEHKRMHPEHNIEGASFCAAQ